MIIGAGFGQLPAIKKAKEMNYRVITIDKNPEALGFPYADVALTIDVVDFKEAIKAAKKYKIDGVMTMQTDLPIPTVGAIVDELNLPGVGLEVAENCSNKIKTRLLFAQKKVPQPSFRVVKNLEEANKAVKEIGIPCVIKSPDSSGSRGVTKVKSLDEVESALNEAFKFSRLDQVLVEEFIDGIEIGAQGFSINNKCVKVLLHNDTLSTPPYMIPVGHSFPIIMSEEKRLKAEQAVATAVDALGIKSGPTNVDIILDKTGEIKVIEIGARIGATCLPELVEYFTGIDWVKATILNSLNEPFSLIETQSKPVAAIILESPKDGVFEEPYIPSNIYSIPELIEVEITAKKGDNVRFLRNGTDRIGKVVAFGDTAEKAEKIVEGIREQIKFSIK